MEKHFMVDIETTGIDPAKEDLLAPVRVCTNCRKIERIHPATQISAPSAPENASKSP